MRTSKPTFQQLQNLKTNDRVFFIYLGQVIDGLVTEINPKTVRVKISSINKTMKVFKESLTLIISDYASSGNLNAEKSRS